MESNYPYVKLEEMNEDQLNDYIRKKEIEEESIQKNIQITTENLIMVKELDKKVDHILNSLDNNLAEKQYEEFKQYLNDKKLIGEVDFCNNDKEQYKILKKIGDINISSD